MITHVRTVLVRVRDSPRYDERCSVHAVAITGVTVASESLVPRLRCGCHLNLIPSPKSQALLTFDRHVDRYHDARALHPASVHSSSTIRSEMSVGYVVNDVYMEKHST